MSKFCGMFNVSYGLTISRTSVQQVVESFEWLTSIDKSFQVLRLSSYLVVLSRW